MCWLVDWIAWLHDILLFTLFHCWGVLSLHSISVDIIIWVWPLWLCCGMYCHHCIGNWSRVKSNLGFSSSTSIFLLLKDKSKSLWFIIKYVSFSYQKKCQEMSKITLTMHKNIHVLYMYRYFCYLKFFYARYLNTVHVHVLCR